MTTEHKDPVIPTWTWAKVVKWLIGITGVSSLIPWLSSHLTDREKLFQGIIAFLAIIISALICALIVWKRSASQIGDKASKKKFIRPLYWKPMGSGWKENFNLITMLAGCSFFVISLVSLMELAVGHFYSLVVFCVLLALGIVCFAVETRLSTDTLRKYLSKPFCILYREHELIEMPRAALIVIGTAFCAIAISPSLIVPVVDVITMATTNSPINTLIISLFTAALGLIVTQFAGFRTK